MRQNVAVTTFTATRRARVPAQPDAAVAAATDLALAAAREVGGDWVGEHRGVQPDAERVATHLFAATQPGYAGWYWSVTLVRASRAKNVTVSEVALLPGPDALLAPEWVPWSERLRPGDLGVGDLLPTAPDDDRLVPGHVLSDDPAVAEVETEIGLGRPRVMSRLGREETAERWYDGDAGPAAEVAKAAPAACGTCGFYLPLAGSLGGLFGACGNLFAPDDGRVVSADHGCGAHSQALVEPVPPTPSVTVVMDDAALDMEVPSGPEPVVGADPSADSVAALEPVADQAEDGADQVEGGADRAEAAAEPSDRG